MLERADYQTFASEEIVLRSPTSEPRVGVIARGRVKATYYDQHYVGACITATLEVNDWVGVETCTGQASGYTVWVAEGTTLVGFLTLRQVQDEGLLTTLLSSAARFSQRLALAGLCAGLPAEDRIKRALALEAESSGIDTEDGRLIPSLSRIKLAEATNLSCETVSRQITALKKQGWIELHGRGVLLKPTLETQQ